MNNSNKLFLSSQDKIRPVIVIILILLAVIAIERIETHRWWCICGQYYPWSTDIWSTHNSQHLLDPYSFTHVLHGIALAGLIALGASRTTLPWRLCIAILIEGSWEILENSSFIINRYRTETLSVGYQGDSIFNSLGDIMSCAIGFMIAMKLGWKRSIALFLIIEAVMLFWIRDSLLLEVIMLIYPLSGIKSWQLHH